MKKQFRFSKMLSATAFITAAYVVATEIVPIQPLNACHWFGFFCP